MAGNKYIAPREKYGPTPMHESDIERRRETRNRFLSQVNTPEKSLYALQSAHNSKDHYYLKRKGRVVGIFTDKVIGVLACQLLNKNAIPKDANGTHSGTANSSNPSIKDTTSKMP